MVNPAMTKRSRAVLLVAPMAAVACLALAFGPASVRAEPAGGTTMVYDIYHENHGHIGEERVTFSRDHRSPASDDLVVDVQIDIAVSLLGLTLYRFEGTRRQEWENGRLIEFQSQTNDDGDDYAVSARLVNGEMQIDTSSGEAEAPAGIFPTDPWNRSIVDQSVVMDTKTGALRSIKVDKVGEETLEIGGRQVPTTKYAATGDEEREVWYDDQDNWVQLRFMRNGSAVTFKLREVSPPEQAKAN